MDKSTWTTKTGLAQMLKGGVIMDVVTPEQARIAEEAGAVAVMALERVPASSAPATTWLGAQRRFVAANDAGVLTLPASRPMRRALAQCVAAAAHPAQCFRSGG